MVASSTRAMMAQRLVRKICKKCGAPYVPTEKELSALGLELAKIEKANFRKGKGCPDCNNTGNRGRMGIFEVYVLNDESRRLINEKSPASELRRQALEMGMRSLREDGARKVVAGVTTPDEVIRATTADVH